MAKRHYQLKIWEHNDGRVEATGLAWGPEFSGDLVSVNVEWDRDAKAWKATDDNGNVTLGKPSDPQVVVALVALAKLLAPTVETPDREQAIDLDLATAMLLDLRDSGPDSPLKLNPLHSILARLARGVLRAHGVKDPTDGRVF